MSNIQGGAISFEALWESGSIERGLKTTEQLVKNFTSLTTKSGADIDAEYKKMAESIQAGFKTIGNTIEINKTAIENLRKKYDDLGSAAAEAFAKGNDNKYNKLTWQQAVIQQEIVERKKVVAALYEQDTALTKLSKDVEDHKNKLDTASNAQVRFRTQLLNVKNQMMQLEQAGKKNTAEYARLTEEAKRLANVMYSANQQIKTLTSVKGATLQGIVSGLSGISGAFTAVNGAMGLFAGKNEELQKIMLRVQSLMSITMGLQAASATLHQTSAFRLTVLTKAQAAYSAVLLASGKALISFGFSANAARIAVQAFYGALTLGFGALLTIAITQITKYINKQNEAKKAQEEFYKSIAENSAKPVATIKKLSHEWNKLGDDLKKKEKFIKDNKKSFEELKWSVKGVSDAEKVLSDPNNVQAFIDAQIAKAKAMAMIKKNDEYVDELVEADQKLKAAKKTPKVTKVYSDFNTKQTYSYEIDNPEIAKWENKIKELNTKIEESYKITAEYEKEGIEKLKYANVEGIKEYAEGTIGALEKAISEEREKLNDISDPRKYKEVEKNINAIQKKIDAITGGKKKEPGKDPLLQELEKKKKAYQEYFTWVNAGKADEAKQEFAELLKGGKTYLDYLKKMREDTSLTKEQIHQITNEIAQETNTTILGEFENSLQEQLNNAQTILEKLDIIEQRRAELDENDPLKGQKEEIISKESKETTKEYSNQVDELINSYSSYVDKKLKIELDYLNKIKIIEKQITNTHDKAEKEKLQSTKTNLQKAKEAEIEELTIIELEESKIYKQIRSVAEEEGRAQLKKRIELLEQYLDEVKQNLGEESEYYKEVKKNVTASKKELVKDTSQSFKEISQIMQSVVSYIGDTNDKMAQTAATIAEQAINIYQAFQSENKSSQVSGIISGILAITAAVRDWRYESLEVYDPLGEQAKLYEQMANSIEVMNMKLERQAKILEGMFGEELMSARINLYESYGKKQIETFEKLKGYPFEYIESEEEYFKDSNIKAKGANKVANYLLFGGQAQTEIRYTFKSIDTSGFNDIEDYRNLLYEIKENGGKIYGKEVVESDIKALEELINAYDEAVDKQKSIMNEIKAYMTASTAGAISDAITNAFMEGKTSAADFAGYFNNLMQNSLKNIFQMKVIDKIANDFYNEFSDKTISDYTLTAEEIAELRNSFTSKIADAQEQWTLFEQLMADSGINLSDSATGLSGAIKGITQEQADIIGGTANAMRTNQIESIEILRNSLIQLTLISANTNKANQYLEKIEENTKNKNYDPLRAEGITG
jgi:hypothetical protein